MDRLKIVVFSDLHPGDGTAADNFGINHSVLVLNKIFEFRMQGFIVILNGDILELMQFTFSQIASHYPNLISILKRIGYVIGNHDKDVRKYLSINVMEEYTFGSNILVYHGHQDDKSMNPWIVRTALKAWAVIERLLGRKISTEVQDTPISPNDPHYKGDKSEYIRNAFKRAKLRNYKIVVIGHTHEPGIFKRDDITVINTGTCAYKHLMYATIIENDNGELIPNLYVDGKLEEIKNG